MALKPANEIIFFFDTLKCQTITILLSPLLNILCVTDLLGQLLCVKLRYNMSEIWGMVSLIHSPAVPLIK